MNRELRNKRIAIEALDLLERVAALDGTADELEWLRDEFGALLARWEGRGVTWLRPIQVPYDPDEWLTAAEMAERADVEPDTVRRWHYRGHITSVVGSDGRPYYNVGEVVAYQARRYQPPQAT